MFFDLDRLEYQFNSMKEHFVEMQNDFIDELCVGEREEFHEWFHHHPDEMEEIIESLHTIFNDAKYKCLDLPPNEVLKILIYGVGGYFMDLKGQQ